MAAGAWSGDGFVSSEESAKLRTWTLPDEELGEILQSPRRGDLLIGGFVDDASHTVTLWRGNLDSITVPFSAFPKSGDGTAPDFSRFAVTDCGQTVQFGDYEASTDSILYENDPDYRRTVKKNRLIADSSLGGSSQFAVFDCNDSFAGATFLRLQRRRLLASSEAKARTFSRRLLQFWLRSLVFHPTN
jgi:hypothetical protein